MGLLKTLTTYDPSERKVCVKGIFFLLFPPSQPFLTVPYAFVLLMPKYRRICFVLKEQVYPWKRTISLHLAFIFSEIFGELVQVQLLLPLLIQFFRKNAFPILTDLSS